MLESNGHRFIEGYPVKYRGKKFWVDFPMRLRWQDGLWFELFEKNVDFIVSNIKRARASGHLIVYLSCPLASRNGSYHKTNVEISKYVSRALIEKFGNRFWILNPAMYQMESRYGTGLIEEHARLLSLEKNIGRIDVEHLGRVSPVTGGDYLRMWLRVLVEDERDNLGDRIDAYYFVGPHDVWDFFTRSTGSKDVGSAIKSYFATEMIDPEFRDYFPQLGGSNELWESFFKYYSLMAGANFSLGSNDEYKIRLILNRIRAECRGLSHQIPGFFDGHQLGFELDLKGYSI